MKSVPTILLAAVAIILLIVSFVLAAKYGHAKAERSAAKAELAVAEAELSAAKDRMAAVESAVKDRMAAAESAARDRMAAVESDAEKLVDDAKKEAESILAEARAQADQVIAKADEVMVEVRGRKALLDKRLYTLFKNLHKLENGSNDVPSGYVKSFELERGDSNRSWNVRIAIEPEKAVTPDVTIAFMNKYGFVTGEASVSWLVDQVEAGERKIESTYFVWHHGPPVYWRIFYK